MRRLLVPLVCALALVVASDASAARMLGVHGDKSRFRSLTGQQTKVGHAFLGWNQGHTWGSRFPVLFQMFGPVPMLALKTGPLGAERISPRAIAYGKGDGYLIAMSRAIAAWAKPIYIRPMPEMNGSWNPYCAYNANGTRRDDAHSTRSYRKAFARIYVILHGGSRADVNAKLVALGLPRIGVDLPENPKTRLRVIWNPQSTGSPNVAGNGPKAYWPGSRYVDVVGNDIYFINGTAKWAEADRLYDMFPGKPYSFPEWGLWGTDNPAFVRRMATFVKAHPRTELIAYYNGPAYSKWDLGTKPYSRAAYRNVIVPLASP